MSEKVPEGWQSKSVNEIIVHFQNGYAFSSSGYVKSGVPIISIVNISLDGKFKFDENKEKKWLSSELTNLQRYQVKNNDLIIAMTDVTPNMAMIGRGAIVNRKATSLLNQRVGLLKTKDTVLPKYLACVFNGDYWRKSAQLSASLGAQANLGTADILKMNLVLPPLPEQKKIASILTSVDEVIETTQKQIDKLQDLKKATMNELLTKGIGHTEFKDSELGRIPKSWEVNRFGEISSQKTLGTTERGGGGVMVPLIKMGDIQSGKVLNEANEKVSKSKLTAQNFLSNGDFLFNTRNTPELVGKVGNYNSNKIAAYDNNLLKIDFLEDVSSLFMGMQFNDSTFKKRLKTLVAGTTSVAAIYWNDLSRFRVLKPNIAEQKEMTSIILSIEKQIDDQKSKLSQTQSLKKSLMQDLLTGKVRVKVN